MLWEHLPAGVRDAVEGHTGRITETTPVSGGVNSDLAVTLQATHGRFFCKATRADSRTAWMHRNELAVHPFLPNIAPLLHWHVDHEGWLLLGFEHIDGRHPDLSPGSPDLEPVLTAVHDLPATPTKAKVASFAGHWRQVPALCGALEARGLELAEGDALLHTDLHPLNILVGGRVRVLDWAWARTGAHWGVDDAFVATRLMLAGHTPDQAERLLRAIPDEFVVALHGMWEYLARKDPRPHRRRLADVAERWARHRVA